MRYISRSKMVGPTLRNRGIIRRSDKMPKTHILLTIVFTSLVWLILDIFLFTTEGFVSGGSNKFPVLDVPSRNRYFKKRDVFVHLPNSNLVENLENLKGLRLEKLQEWRDALLQKGDGKSPGKSERQAVVEHVAVLEDRMVKEEPEVRPKSFKDLHDVPAENRDKLENTERFPLELERDNNAHEMIIEEKGEERPKSFGEIQKGALLSTMEDGVELKTKTVQPENGKEQGVNENAPQDNKEEWGIDVKNRIFGNIEETKYENIDIVEGVVSKKDQIVEVELGATQHRQENRKKKNGKIPHMLQSLMKKDLAHNNSSHSSSTLLFEKVRNLDARNLPRVSTQAGEGGRGVLLSAEEDAIAKQLWNRNHFNVFASDKISLERSVPDPRPAECKVQPFPYKQMPKTSIIMCFTDEAWSPLLRSVHSVLNRSPPELLHELILVDDYSQKEHLKQKLDDYVRHLPKVKILRLSKREGLIRARLAAVAMAEGEVITFLDSHIECNVGWLEPLLERIRTNPRAVPSPVIDSISASTFGYSSANADIRGGFNWQALMFKWASVPDYEKNRLKGPTDAVRSPTMAGGLFAIRKDFFYQLGTYDPGLQIWGGENIELSFKVWMCGGSLEICPCSHVAHVFRSKQPYSFPGGDNISVFLRNSLRVATVWLDEYLEAFFIVQPELRLVDVGNVTDRLNLKKSLHCKNFDWYLKNVYPELVVPGFRLKAQGEVKNIGTGTCLDLKAGTNYKAGVTVCHGHGGNQHFRLTGIDKMEVADKCLVSWSQTIIKGVTCENSQQTTWQHLPGGYLKDSGSGLCLTVGDDRRSIFLTVCRGTNSQLWTFANYTGK